MLQLCESFDVKFDLKFNVVKSCVGYMSSSVRAQVQFLLVGKVLPWVDRLKYLGIAFIVGKDYHLDCSERVRKFIATVSSELRFKRQSYEHIFADILIRKCLSVLFYGLDSCSLSYDVMKSVSKAWNMAFKWLFNMRKYDSTRLLFLSHNTMSMKILLDLKTLSFYATIYSTNNALINKFVKCSYSVRQASFAQYGLSLCENVSGIKRSVTVYNAFLGYCSCKL